MKIIHTPTVYLIGKQSIQQAELDRFLANHEVTWQTDTEVAAEAICETAGRLCYMSFAKPRPGGNHTYLEHILEVGHGSVVEHAVWNFIITGVSRSLTHELVRHRAGTGFSQLSQRYVDESVAEYVEPAIIAQDPELHALWVDTVHRIHDTYVLLSEKLMSKLEKKNLKFIKCEECNGSGDVDLERGGSWGTCQNCNGFGQVMATGDKTTQRKMARQAARSVLPNATETKLVLTANARALRHMIEMRCSQHADTEIRVLFGLIWEIMAKDAPNLFGDYEKVMLPDGTFELTTKYRKV